MKQGKSTITHPGGGFPPIVEVGNDDRIVRVSFGTMQFVLSNVDSALVVIVRAEAYDQAGNRIQVESRGAADIRNQFEFRVEAGSAG